MNKTAKIVFSAFLFIVSQTAFSASNAFIVDTTSDENDASPGNGFCLSSSGNCSLRAAIEEANAKPGSDFITLPAGTYTLTITGRDENAASTGDLDITDDVVITGAGAATTIVNGGANDRVFDISPVVACGSAQTTTTVTLNALSVTNGRVQVLGDTGDFGDGGLGGGISNGGSLTLNDIWVYGNTAMGQGGGIHSQSSIVLNHTLVYRNISSAGIGLSLVSGSSQINNSFIINNGNLGNALGGIGGGIINFSDLTIKNSLLYGNQALDGGGLYHGFGVLDMSNTTISSNIADRNGGGIVYRRGGVGASLAAGPSLTHVTIANNTARGNDRSGAGGMMFPGFTPGAGSFPGGCNVDPIDFSIPAGDSDGSLGGAGIVVTGQVNSNQPDVTLVVANSIVANNVGGSGGGMGGGSSVNNCGFSTAGSIVSRGGNLESANSCGFLHTADLVGADPLLVPMDVTNVTSGVSAVPAFTQAEFDILQPHTQTVEITSPAIDKAVDSYCSSVDQPGRQRPSTGCDIGAFELLPPTANPMQYVVTPGDVITGAFVVSYVTKPFIYEILTTGTQGTAGLAVDASNPNWEYRANSGASGSDSFTYRTCFVDTPTICSEAATIGILFTGASQISGTVSIEIAPGSGTASPITVIGEEQLLAQVADVDYTFPLGAFFFDVADLSVASSVLTLTIQLPADTAIPVDAVVRKLDNTGVWQTMGSAVSSSISYASIDRLNKIITLNLIDNDMFDSNPTLGLIRDPVALGIPDILASTNVEANANQDPDAPAPGANNNGQPNNGFPGTLIDASGSPASGGGSLGFFALFLFGLAATLRLVMVSKQTA